MDLNEPYVEVYEVIQNSTFIAKKAKIYEKEKEVANKAPVDSVNINDLNSNTEKEIKYLSKEGSQEILFPPAKLQQLYEPKIESLQ